MIIHVGLYIPDVENFDALLEASTNRGTEVPLEHKPFFGRVEYIYVIEGI